MSYSYDKETKLAKITTPRGTVIQTRTDKGKVKTELQWNPGFSAKWNGRAMSAQKYVDTRVLDASRKYLPLRSSMLELSGDLGTVIGSGEVAWIAPYAAKQYYETADTRSYDAQRGGHWFIRMKADHGKEIIVGAKERMGGKT